MKLIYLAGPISGASCAAASGWRQRAERELGDRYEVLNPLRPFFPDRDAFAVTADRDGARFSVPLQEMEQRIFCRDRFDVLRADVCLANFEGAVLPSMFTMMEVAWSCQAGKFVLIVLPAGEPANPHQHFCVRHAASLIVSTLDDAISFLRAGL